MYTLWIYTDTVHSDDCIVDIPHSECITKANIRDVLKTCSTKDFVTITCFSDHDFPVPIRCMDCPGCFYQYRLKVLARFLERSDKYNVSQFYLWTFGTDLDLTYHNELKLKEWWHKLCTRLSTYSKRSHCDIENNMTCQFYLFRGGCPDHERPWQYDPLIRVIEIGSSGKKLHYHVIYGSYLPHEVALKAWRDITGLEANVNYRSKEKKWSRFKASAYVAKYVTKNKLLLKETRSYYWMGRFRKNPQNEVDRICKTPGCNQIRYVREYTYF